MNTCHFATAWKPNPGTAFLSICMDVVTGVMLQGHDPWRNVPNEQGDSVWWRVDNGMLVQPWLENVASVEGDRTI
jgi:hypothetical protein